MISRGYGIYIVWKHETALIGIEQDYSRKVVSIKVKTGLKITNTYTPVKSQEQITFFEDLDDYANDTRNLIVLGDISFMERRASWLIENQPETGRQLTALEH